MVLQMALSGKSEAVLPATVSAATSTALGPITQWAPRLLGDAAQMSAKQLCNVLLQSTFPYVEAVMGLPLIEVFQVGNPDIVAASSHHTPRGLLDCHDSYLSPTVYQP